ncbi:TRAP transporter substrate-binding protein [Lachnoclostridium pacaense]|uniref:TRAP transporter substrate-binding protein n=1 Tax=Enterocloster hominis (ex Hitch et al. 2024) TaxID=1917870 RepID=UPI001D127AC5|nr:TRAP transporter substrate-binding protein [Lachnoclostridium pacaense]MCC2877729.1 TRAP transporter substrate-binding protein [Lachnoclostridium pacaense]
MKQIKWVILMGLMSLSLSACGQKTVETTNSPEVKAETGTAAQAPLETAAQAPAKAEESKPEYEMIIALHTAPGTIEDQAIERFKEKVEERTNGKVVVNIFPGAQLGAEKENLEQMMVGEIQGSIFGDVMTSQLAPDLDPTVIPFIYKNVDDVFSTWNGPIGDKIKQACIDKGNIRVVGIGRRGARYLLGNKEMPTPADVKGVKLRLPEIDSWVSIWSTVGALPTPIAFSEVYSALQTGVCDSFESTLELVYTGKYYEVQKYAMKTEHLYGLFHFGIAESWLLELPEDMRNIIIEEGDAACKWGDEKAANYESEMAEKLQENGMTIIDVDKQAYIDAVMPAIEKVAQTWQPEVWEEVQKYME